MLRLTKLTQSIRGALYRPLVASVLLGAVVGTATIGVNSATRSEPASVASSALVSTPASFADIVDRTRPAVVVIKTSGGGERQMANLPLPRHLRRFFEHRHDQPQPTQGMGSGFIVASDGQIVTNYHVIKGADEITVVTVDGEEFKAVVKGVDEKTDLALLSIDAGRPLATVSFGDSDTTRVGDWVVAVGNPFGLGGTYTAGIVSARGRNIQAGPYDDFLQIDAPINRGNSGGALFNVQGEVVGVNTAIFSPNGGNVGIGFAVPAKIASKVIGDLREDGHVQRAWLGVQIQAVSKSIAESLGRPAADGALVVSVQPGSPADEAALRPGDVIFAVGDETVAGMRDLPRLIAGMQIDKSVALHVWRDGRETVLKASLRAVDRPERVASVEREEATPPLGLALAPLSDRYRSELGWPHEAHGVVVVGVAPGSQADAQRIRPGMVITMVGRHAVDSPQAVAELVGEARALKRKNVLLLISNRFGNAEFVALPLV